MIMGRINIPLFPFLLSHFSSCLYYLSNLLYISYRLSVPADLAFSYPFVPPHPYVCSTCEHHQLFVQNGVQTSCSPLSLFHLSSSIFSATSGFNFILNFTSHFHDFTFPKSAPFQIFKKKKYLDLECTSSSIQS